MKVRFICPLDYEVHVPVDFDFRTYVNSFLEKQRPRAHISRFELNESVPGLLLKGKTYKAIKVAIKSEELVPISEIKSFVEEQGGIFGGAMGLLLFLDQNTSAIIWNSVLHSFEPDVDGLPSSQAVAEYDSEKDLMVYQSVSDRISSEYSSISGQGSCTGSVRFIYFKEV